MKNIFKHIIILFFSTGCSNDKQKSDAYGNFEATETIVSSESSGKLNEFNVEEGMIIESGDIVVLHRYKSTIPEKKSTRAAEKYNQDKVQKCLCTDFRSSGTEKSCSKGKRKNRTPSER